MARPQTTRSSGRPQAVSTCFAAVVAVAGPASGAVAVAVARAVAAAAWNPPSPPTTTKMTRTTRQQRPNDNETPASGTMNIDQPKVRKIPAYRDGETAITQWWHSE